MGGAEGTKLDLDFMDMERVNKLLLISTIWNEITIYMLFIEN